MKRNETNYRKTTTKDDCFSPHLGAKTSERIRRYCSLVNINKTRFVETCVNDYLDKMEKRLYEQMTKEQLIEMLLEKDAVQGVLELK